jgi:hypothetical protein
MDRDDFDVRKLLISLNAKLLKSPFGGFSDSLLMYMEVDLSLYLFL